MKYEDALNKIEMAFESKPRKNKCIYVNAEAIKTVMLEMAGPKWDDVDEKAIAVCDKLKDD